MSLRRTSIALGVVAVCSLQLSASSGRVFGRLRTASEKECSFASADADSDGAITFDELQRVASEHVNHAFVSVDLNGDGVLSVQEYARLADASPAQKEHSFASVDADSDGAITFDELQRVASEHVNHVFASVDLNGDGVLSVQEFARLAASSSSPLRPGHAKAAEAPRNDGVRLQQQEDQNGEALGNHRSAAMDDARRVYQYYYDTVLAIESANAKLLETFEPRRRGAGGRRAQQQQQQQQRYAAESDDVDETTFFTPRMPAIASLHHFACSGGTLIARCLHAMRGAFVVSEVDPLSTLNAPQGSLARFAPTDLIRQMRSARPGHAPHFADHDVIDVFLAGLETLALRASNLSGPVGVATSNSDTNTTTTITVAQKLVVRDHPHSHFCAAGGGAAAAAGASGIPARPTLAAMLSLRFQLSSAVTIRHPMASYLSLSANNWDQTGGLDDYARRYLVFLHAYAGVRLFKYETFVHDPDTVLKGLCRTLGIPFDPGYRERLADTPLSGNSGRQRVEPRTNIIACRPPRAITTTVRKELAAGAPHYLELCRILGYDPHNWDCRDGNKDHGYAATTVELGELEPPASTSYRDKMRDRKKPPGRPAHTSFVSTTFP